ncbi:MAG: MarR family winged helix-turn-helix transcriptional regulator, partial [Candidatus Thorarchaeota archaeon]
MKSEDYFLKFYQLVAFLAENYFNPFIKQPQNVDITKTGISIINFIGTRRECIIKEITETFKISPSTASEHIDRLYKTKYIFKHTPEDDQRKVVLSLTDKGLVVY